MPRFLCLQRTLATGPGEAADEPSPARMQELYAQFGAWRDTFKAQLVDMGGKLGDGRLVTDASPADGPFVEVKELVGGYMIVEADTVEGAIEVARACPGLVSARSGCEVIEIRTP
ncbi:MAG: YciI family protein [Sandaracinaceae bacterium]